MAPRKSILVTLAVFQAARFWLNAAASWNIPRSRHEPSSAMADAPTTSINIDETHAVQLARHLAELYKRRRFTDLKVHDRPCFPKRRDLVRWAPSGSDFG
jgi:hypothetical protein